MYSKNSKSRYSRGTSSRAFIYSITDMLFSPSRSTLFILDLIVINAFFIFATWLSPYGNFAELKQHNIVGSSSFSIAFCVMAMGLGYYERTRRYSLYKIYSIGFISMAVALAFGLTTVYFAYYNVFGRLTFLWGAAGGYIGVTVFRTILALIYRSIPYSFSVIGNSPTLDEIISYCQITGGKDSRYFNYVSLDSVLKDNVLTRVEFLKKNHVSDLVFSKEALNDSDLSNFALECLKNKIKLVDEADFYSQMFEKLPLMQIDKTWILINVTNPRNIGVATLKRVMDMSLAIIGIILSAPLLLLIGFLIKLEDGGPVLFIQSRMGRYGEEFRMFKFRSMKIAYSDESASRGFTKVGDDRISMVGKLIRPLHLDELPQLFNILLGDMSVVGPRPEAIGFARKMMREIELYDTRYLIRPGLTGHAQLLGGYMMDTVEGTKKKLALDLFYLVNHNFFVDVRVIIRTFFIVIKSMF